MALTYLCRLHIVTDGTALNGCSDEDRDLHHSFPSNEVQLGIPSTCGSMLRFHGDKWLPGSFDPASHWVSLFFSSFFFTPGF